MYAKGAADRQPTEVEKLIACPTCKVRAGMPCFVGMERTELPHNKRAIAAEALAKAGG